MSHIFEKASGICPHCREHVGVAVDHRIQIYPEVADWSEQDFETVTAGRMMEAGAREIIVLTCRGCQELFTILDSWEDGDDGAQLASRTLVDPVGATRELPSAAPEKVASLFTEASVCESAGALRAAGALYRSTTEELLQDQGATGATLEDKINSMSSKLDADLIKSFEDSRIVGNDSVHHGVEYAPDEIVDLAELIQEAVVVLYEEPARRAQMRAAREARHAPIEAAKQEQKEARRAAKGASRTP